MIGMIQMSTPRHSTFCDATGQQKLGRDVGHDPLAVPIELAADDALVVGESCDDLMLASNAPLRSGPLGFPIKTLA
jgi:hypothetical protein